MLRYSMLIQWSDKDQCYLVTLPEWPNLIGEAPARGDTYEEAARNGRAVLEKLPDSAIKTEPWTYKPIVYADKEEALKRFREEIMPQHDELFRELAAIEQKEQEETQEDEEEEDEPYFSPEEREAYWKQRDEYYAKLDLLDWGITT